MRKNFFKTFLLLALVSSVFSLTACTNGAGEVKNKYTARSKTVSYTHFNTVTVLSSYGDTTEEEFESYVTVVDDMLEYYHELFDIYYEYEGVNNVKTVNNNAGNAPVEVDKELIDFLVRCKELYTATQGKTNVMLGSVLKIWHGKRELADANGGYLDENLLPSYEELAKASKHTSIDLLVIDENAKTVYISDPLASLDVGAVAKGYAVEKIVEKLKLLGADSIAINAGGNIATIGTKPDGELWTTGITNPDKTVENSLACRVEIGEISLVTSGDYERYFVSDKKNYHHIIDPETLMPAEYFSSVSVFAKDSALADALSTALFCMPYEDGLKLIEDIKNVDVLWIYKDGEIKYTEGVKMAE